MNYKKRISSVLLTVLPLPVFAHGEEVLLTIAIYPISFVILLVFMAMIKMQMREKLKVVSAYVLSAIVTFFITNFLPYNDNANIINAAAVLVPFVAVVITYDVLKRRDSK